MNKLGFWEIIKLLSTRTVDTDVLEPEVSHLLILSPSSILFSMLRKHADFMRKDQKSEHLGLLFFDT